MKHERYLLNGKKVKWSNNKKSKIYNLTINGVETTHTMFGEMVKYIETETGVNYPW